jgi:hypothetical protein
MTTEEKAKGVLEGGLAHTADPDWQPLSWRYRWKRQFRCQLPVHVLRTGSSALNHQNDQKALTFSSSSMDPLIIRAVLLQVPRKMACQVATGISVLLKMVVEISYRV